MELKNNIVHTPNSDMDLQYNTGTLLEILFIEGGRDNICRGELAGG